MLAVPPSVLEILELKSGDTVGLKVDEKRLVVEPLPGPKYTLDELLAASDYEGTRNPDEEDWLRSAAVGREIL